MKQLLILSTSLFMAASAIGIYNFIDQSTNPLFQHLYSSQKAQHPEKPSMLKSNQIQKPAQPPLFNQEKKDYQDTTKTKSRSSLMLHHANKNRHQKKNIRKELDLKTFSRASPIEIENPVEAVPSSEDEHLEIK